MAYSMTAYAREEIDASWGTAAWELRSVNHRYLDASLRLPEELRALEPVVRERIGQGLRRGKVECTLRMRVAPGQAGRLSLNLELARQLVDAATALAELTPGEAPAFGAAELLRWPGVIEPPELDTDAVGGDVLELLDRALGELRSARAREGEQLAGFIRQRCEEIERIALALRDLLPEIIRGQRERLLARLSDLPADLEPGRLEQEMVLYAQKIDVTEELDRLQAHLGEVRRTLGLREPVGRRLDFLMQELNREANTLGSKSVDAKTTAASVDLKVLIEQMREQVQNIE